MRPKGKGEIKMSEGTVYFVVIMVTMFVLGWMFKDVSLDIKAYRNKKHKLTILGQDKTF